MYKHYLELLNEIKNNSIQNYAIAGLTSSLMGGGEFGKVRLFEQTIDQQNLITPHSHRFDLLSIVLSGTVENTIYEHSGNDGSSEEMMRTIINYDGVHGVYKKEPGKKSFFSAKTKTYDTGRSYFMFANNIHSIVFSKGAKVLILEGPTKKNSSVILEPIVDGQVIPLFKTESWMFLSGDK